MDHYKARSRHYIATCFSDITFCINQYHRWSCVEKNSVSLGNVEKRKVSLIPQIKVNLGMFTFFPPNSKSELLLHSLSPHSKPGDGQRRVEMVTGRTIICCLWDSAWQKRSPLAAICHFWWLVKSGHVSIRRLRSHEWLKRFFLERSAVGHFFQTAFLAASCPASNSSAGRWGGGHFWTVMAPKLQRSLLGIFAWNLPVAACQTNAPWKVFCFTLCCLEWIKGSAKGQTLQRETVLWNNTCLGDISS